MIKYIGSKRSLVPWILENVAEQKGVRTAMDVFAGSARVGHAFKSQGMAVVANDHNAYSATLAKCYVEADRETVERDAALLISEFSRLPGVDGYFTQTFCRDARFFQPENGERVDAIRHAIESKGLPPDLKAVLLVSLMEAADRVDSTVGVQMAYLKAWAPRSKNPLELRLPDVLPAARHGAGSAHQMDALDFVRSFEADVVYLDPPYNQHKYLGNYHIWETLVLWDKPEAYGVARKRVDCRTRTSSFNSRPHFEKAMSELINAVTCKFLIVSFSDEGYVTPDAMLRLLETRGAVRVVDRPYRRHVGARIGIHNPQGERVGTVSHTANREFLFVVEVTTEAMSPRVVEHLAPGTARFEASADQ